MTFTKGDKAYYPPHGVGVIRKIETKVVAGTSMKFYVIQFLSTGATLMVPIDASSRTGMRGLITENEIKKVYKILKTPKKVSTTTWNRRYRDYSDKIKTGEPQQIASVLRDLSTLQSQKNLSDGEKTMFKKARSLIVEEICLSQKIKELDVSEKIDKMLLVQQSV